MADLKDLGTADDWNDIESIKGKNGGTNIMKKEDIITREELIAYLDQCKRELKTPDISHIRLSGMDLNGICFDYAYAKGTIFDDCDLADCTFYYTNLVQASFERARGNHVDFTKANATYAKFNGADLYDTNFIGTVLNSSTFDNVTFFNCDLHKAELFGASFLNANLMRCRFSYSYELKQCVFTGANVQGSDFTNSFLGGCIDLETCKGFDVPLACPQTGSFIGWKVAYGFNEEKEIFVNPYGRRYIPKAFPFVLIKLRIPEDARRSSATTTKCRAEKAEVLDIISLDDSSHFRNAMSIHDLDFVYTVGNTVKVSDFDTNRFNECSTGIHFFMSKKSAIAYFDMVAVPR